jgi:sensor histidine kinase YesM
VSTLSDLKSQRNSLSIRISEISITVTDEDQKGQILQELNEQIEEIEAEIEEIETEEKAAKEAKKQAKQNKKK